VQFFLKQLKRKYIIIEDCSQGSLIETKHPQVGTIGHFVFTSLRKYLPVPSGALLKNNSTYTLRRDIAEDNNFTENRLLAKLLRNYYVKQSSQENTVETVYLDIFRNEELSLDKHIEIAKMALISMQILNNLDFSDIINRRRTNFNQLATFFKLYFENHNCGSIIIDSLPDNISPQYFLIRIKTNRNLVRKSLVSENIYCPILWPYIVGDSNLIYKETVELSNEILCIPIDQRYSPQDMEFIIGKITNVLNRIL
jgi:dTDP-4-amino-4,6-dideoxygalactose transaminase